MTCIKCNIAIEIYCTSTGEEIKDVTERDKFICEDCILGNYMHHRTNAMISDVEFEMVPWLEEIIFKKYKNVRSLRHRYN